MRKLKHINIKGSLINYFADESLINVIVLSRASSQFISYDPDSLKPLGSFWINRPIKHYATTHIDDSFFYLPTGDGDLVAIDKFSGIEMVLFDLGYSIPLGVCNSEYGLFVLSGIPTNNNKNIKTSISVCLCDKDTGKKLFQGPSMNGNFLPLVFNEYLWCIVGTTLYKYSPECEILASANLKVIPDFPPLVTDNYIITCSTIGSMEIFNKNDLSINAKILVSKNTSPPVHVSQDKIYWFTNNRLYYIDARTGRSDAIVDTQANIASTAIYHNNILYTVDEIGNLIKIDTINMEVDRIKITNQPLWKPVVFSKYIFVSSQNSLFQIEA